MRTGVVSIVRIATMIAVGLLGVVASSRAFAADSRTKAEARRPNLVTELGISIGGTAVLAPAIYSSARLVGTSSSNLNTSALPALLLATLLPPLAATSLVAYSRHRDGYATKWLPTYLSGVSAELLVLAGAFLAKTWVAQPSDLLLLSGVTGLGVGGASTLGAELSF